MNPFRGEGEWLKAALHTHSTVSDGTLAPDRLVQSYVEAGFDIVAITDHWRLTQPNARDDVILVPIGIYFALKLIPQPVIDKCRLQARDWLNTQHAKLRNHIAAAVIVVIWLAALWWAWNWFSARG